MQQQVPLKGLGYEMNKFIEGLKFTASLLFRDYSVQQQIPLKGLGHEINTVLEGLKIHCVIAFP